MPTPPARHRSSHHQQQQPVCVDLGGANRDLECLRVDDVLERRQQVDGGGIDTGVVQEIDGSENEKEAIRQILRAQDEYFVKHVLAEPEYEYARHHCKNQHKLCAFWGSLGECTTNRSFMLRNCPAACRFCLLLNSGLAD